MTTSLDEIANTMGVEKYYRINTPVEYCFVDKESSSAKSYAYKEYITLLSEIDQKIDDSNFEITKAKSNIGKYMLLLNKKIQYIMHTTSKYYKDCNFAFVNLSSTGAILESHKKISTNENLNLYLFFINTFDSIVLNANVNKVVDIDSKCYVSVDFTEVTEAEEDRIIKNIFESERKCLQAEKLEKV